VIGEKTSEVQAYWNERRKALRITTDAYFAGTFANPTFAPYHDELLDLVGAGGKRATAHLLLDFEQNNIPERSPGDYWVVLDTMMKPRFLIRITDVDLRPFNSVEQSFAEREGEGDGSLAYWAEVHREYFCSQCEDWGIPWCEDLITVCEGFDLIA